MADGSGNRGSATGRTTTPVGIIDDVPMTPPVIHRAVQFDGEFPIMPIHSGNLVRSGQVRVSVSISK